ncbi:MAG: hypothetical protein GX835_06845 [Desulfobulbaceae bacterium]|jgi:hypothetical protein|nr:hypothetical protein [Desulfobulbus sp.]MBP8815001.1 hypothetical protein [Desulfobulbus sp.]NLB06666.1 hypothetical protein [Desulfobulbaceae bacterium]
MTNLLASLQANEKTVRAVCWALLAVFAGATFFVDNHHAHTWAERHVPFFWSFFGFGAAAVIIGVARWLGRSGIQTGPEVYGCAPSATCEDE